MRVVLVVAVTLLLAACSSGQRLDTIDRRLTHLEETQQDRKRELEALEARLFAALGRVMTAIVEAGGTADLARQLDELSKQLAALEAKIAKPAPRREPAPDPADVFAVGVAGAPSDGPADALVTIVRAYEYACPYCEKSRATMAELRRRYPREVRIVYRPFIVHPAVATLPAEAACAADKQGLFREADLRLWDEAYAQRKFDQAEMERIAVAIGADLDIFRADMTGACTTEVAADQAALKKVGVRATPAFFINGRFLSGAQSVETFAALVDEELALASSRMPRKKKAVAKARRGYYDTWVIAKGKATFTPPAQP